MSLVSNGILTPAPPRYRAPDVSRSCPTELVDVAFHGDGGGSDVMAWGQAGMWMLLVEQGSWIPMGGTKPLDAGTTVEDIAGELRYLMTRYPSMRTRLRFTGDGPPTQIVHERGAITLEIVDAGDDDPAALADLAYHRIADAPLDFTTEWPIRMAIVRQHGFATHMAVAISHLVADASGNAIMMAEVAARQMTPVDGMPALTQVAWQRSPAGQRQHDAAVRYWRNQLREVRNAGPRDLGEVRDPRHWHGELHSPALALAVSSIAARTRIEPTNILLTAYATALSRIADLDPAVIAPTVSNRFRPGLSDVVGVVAQRGLCVLAVADLPFEEALLRCQRATMAAYKYAYYDPTRMLEVIAALGRDRGEDLNPTCHFNDRRGSGSGRGTPGAEPVEMPVGQVRAALTETTFGWVEGRDNTYEPLMVHVDDAAGRLDLTVTMDTALLSPDRAEALVREMEAIAVTASGT